MPPSKRCSGFWDDGMPPPLSKGQERGSSTDASALLTLVPCLEHNQKAANHNQQAGK